MGIIFKRYIYIQCFLLLGRLTFKRLRGYRDYNKIEDTNPNIYTLTELLSKELVARENTQFFQTPVGRRQTVLSPQFINKR